MEEKRWRRLVTWWCDTCLKVITFAAADVAISDRNSSENSNPELVCPHCQVKGKVHTREINKKVGISGSKATAAVLTGGISILATGLSRKDHLTEAHCFNCGSTWTF